MARTTGAAGSPALALPSRLTLRAPAGRAALAVMVAAALVLVADAASGPSFLVPAGHASFPRWLAGPLAPLGEPITPRNAGLLLCALTGGYLVAVWAAGALAARTVAGAIVLLHLVFLIGPPIFSADVFGYVNWARMATLHHLNPYATGPMGFPADPVHDFVTWHHGVSPYGPLFTLLSYATVPLGVVGAYVAFKALAAASSLAIVALVWRMADRRGGDGATAAALVGLNPALLAFEVGGAHNDVLPVLATMAGVAFVTAGRGGEGAAAIMAAAAAKASSITVLPFALVASRPRGHAMAGATVAAGAIVALALVAFGADSSGFVHAMTAQQRTVAVHSVPAEVSRRLLGLPTATAAVRLAALLAGVVAAAGALRVAARRDADWVAAAGWATLAVLVTSAWLLPWYVTWLLPLAAAGGSRRLRITTLAFTIYVVATRVPFLLE